MSLELSIDSKKLQQAILKAPDVLERELDLAIGRILPEMARAAKDEAPKSMSTLTNSIKDDRISPLEGIVAPHVNYARAVEEGTDGGYYPPPQNILDWIRAGSGITPNDPDMDDVDLAHAISRSIAQKGTQPHPYMAPAFENKKARADFLINRAIERALQ